MPGGRPQTAPHGTDSRYGNGCRCPDCREAHAEVSSQWRFEREFGEGAPRGPKWRRDVLRSLAKTRNVIETARELETTHQAIYAAARAVDEFGEQVTKLTAPKE